MFIGNCQSQEQSYVIPYRQQREISMRVWHQLRKQFSGVSFGRKKHNWFCLQSILENSLVIGQEMPIGISSEKWHPSHWMVIKSLKILDYFLPQYFWIVVTMKEQFTELNESPFGFASLITVSLSPHQLWVIQHACGTSTPQTAAVSFEEPLSFTASVEMSIDMIYSVNAKTSISFTMKFFSRVKTV
jgi:hypothetical protein